MKKAIGITITISILSLAFWVGLLGYQKTHAPKKIQDVLAQTDKIDEGLDTVVNGPSTGRPGRSEMTATDAKQIAEQAFTDKGGKMDNAQIEAEDAETSYAVFIKDETGRELYAATVDKMTGEIIISRFWN